MWQLYFADQLSIQKLHATEAGSLHLEGRMALLQLSGDTSAASMSTLSNLALCAGAAYVRHNGECMELCHYLFTFY